MYKKSMAWMIIFAMILSLFIGTPIKAQADTVVIKSICDADVLPNGDIAVLYISEGKVYLGQLNPSTNNWSKQEIGSGKEAAMALDASGRVHIAYIKTNDDLAYTYYNGTSWTSEKTIDSLNFGGASGVLTNPDIAIDSSGKAHITYMDSKAGYSGGNDYTPYDVADLMYATNVSGSDFAVEVRSYSHGWFWSPDGWRNYVIAPPKITYVGGNYYIGVKQYNYDKGMGFQYHTYNYSLLLPIANTPNNYNIEIRSATTNNDLGFQLYSLDTDGTNVYSLYRKSGNLYVVNGTTEITTATKAFSGSSADLFIPSGGGGSYAAIDSSTLLLCQNGNFKENITLPSAISSTNTMMATVISDSKQYVLYTDTSGNLWECGVPTAAGDTTLSTYKIPDKAPVTISGISVSGKTYDGSAISYSGTPSATVTATSEGASVSAYDYSWYDVTNSQTLASAPKAAGSYKLIVSVPQSDQTYTGTLEIPFTISKKTITISGVKATDRTYNGTTAVAITGGTLVGVESSDAVTANVPSSGTLSDANAAEDKAVSISNITLSGTDSINYTLTQPTGITVDISKAPLTINSVTLASKTYDASAEGSVASVTFDGLQNSESLTISTDFSATCTFDNANAGTGKTAAGTVSLLSTAKANNYNLADGSYSKNEDIAKASGLSAINPADIKVYKNMEHEYSIDLASIGLNKLDTGTVSYSLGTLSGDDIFKVEPSISSDGSKLNFTSESVSIGTATQTITVTTQNYQNATATLAFVMTDKEAVTISGLSIASKVYDATAIAYIGLPSAKITSTGTDVAISTYSYTWYDVTNSTVLLSAPKDAGSYKLRVFVADSNLTYTGFVEIPFSIQKKDLTIKPVNKTINKNDALPSLEIEYVGLASGDTGSSQVSFNEALVMQIQDGVGNPLNDSFVKGTYPIVFTNNPTITSANYNVTTAGGTLKIEKLPVVMNYTSVDTLSGITAFGLEKNVNIPEKTQEDIKEVTLILKAMNAIGNQSYDDIFKASESTIKEKGYILLSAFDLKIVKKIKTEDGTVTEVTVSNSEITGPITVCLPIPEDYQQNADLGIAYIDENGEVQKIESNKVLIEGKYYLQFTTNHFSIYGIVKIENASLPKTGETPMGYYTIGLLILAAGALLLVRRKITQ